jgi:hypothetical protein
VTDSRFGAEYRPMYMQTEGGAVFKGGPEAAAFLVCRCGVPVKVGMEVQHERLIAHASPAADAGPTTEVRRSDVGLDAPEGGGTHPL